MFFVLVFAKMLAKSPNCMNSNNKQGKWLGSFEIPRHFRIFSWLCFNLSIKMTDLTDSFCESWVNSKTIPQSIFTQYSSFEIMGLLKKRVALNLKIFSVGTSKNVEFHTCKLETNHFPAFNPIPTCDIQWESWFRPVPVGIGLKIEVLYLSPLQPCKISGSTWKIRMQIDWWNVYYETSSKTSSL